MTETISFAYEAYRSKIGKRCTLRLPDGRVLTGKVLRGTAFDGTRFALRCRATHYVLMEAAPRLRLAPALPPKVEVPARKRGT